jgi:hypothetical protein
LSSRADFPDTNLPVDPIEGLPALPREFNRREICFLHSASFAIDLPEPTPYSSDFQKNQRTIFDRTYDGIIREAFQWLTWQ